MGTALSQKIVSHIQDTGRPLTFFQFMEMALYDEEYGYYATGGDRARLKVPASLIGLDGGDYYTAPCVSSFFAQALARQLREVDALLGYPSEFTLLEMGPGHGQCMKDVLEEITRADPGLFSRLNVILIEPSGFLRQIQERTLEDLSHRANITWVKDLCDLPDNSVHGFVMSNELVDAFPVHRVRMERDGFKEIYVNHVEGQFVEQLDEPSTDELTKTLRELDANLPVGFTTEINVSAMTWMQQVARVVGRGVVVTIDYGHTSQDYFSPVRKDGTLLCYFRHTVSTNPYEHIGEQDITAHVNFSNLAQVGEKAGLSVTGFTNLMHFLMSLGIEEMVAGFDQESEEIQAAVELLRPQGMGTTFKVLVQHKDVDASSLRALRHRPFFEHVLIPEGGGT